MSAKMNIDGYGYLFMLVGAELFVLLVRSQEIVILAKSGSQRSVLEQRRVDRGLLRMILLELFLFVPTSAALFFFVGPALFHKWDVFPLNARQHASGYFLLGILSWGFPFASIRALITRVAMRTMQHFVQVCQVEMKDISAGFQKDDE